MSYAVFPPSITTDWPVRKGDLPDAAEGTCDEDKRN